MTKKEKEIVHLIIRDYIKTWTLLFKYDNGTLKVPKKKIICI